MATQDQTAMHSRLTFRLVAIAIVVFAMFGVRTRAEDSEESLPQLTAAIEPLRGGVTEEQVLTELAARNEQRKLTLHDYTAMRTYQVIDLKGKLHAEEIGRMEFLAPDSKKFTVTSEAGSGVVRRMALGPLINSEIEAASGREHRDSSISADNYSLNLLGEQQVGSYRCFVAEAVPKRKDKYLFEGKLWIDANDYSVVRIEGHPAKKPSFWIQRADFVRQYQKIDGFWLPQKDQTLVQVRLYGKKILKIEHSGYSVNGSLNNQARTIMPVEELPAAPHAN